MLTGGSQELMMDLPLEVVVERKSGEYP